MKTTTAPGQLILAGNSLGHPNDIPVRTLESIRTADLLVFEEDRGARHCLKAAGVFRDYLRYNEHDQKDTLTAVRKALKRGQTVCYTSDQGMPTIADPGQSLLDIAYQLSAKIQVVPGPSSISTALAACPFLGNRYQYLGFLARDEHERQKEIESLADLVDPIVILDTPYRRKKLLGALLRVLGPERRALLAVDISGAQEAYYLDKLETMARLDLPKLNFVLIVEGRIPAPQARRQKPRTKKLAKKG